MLMRSSDTEEIAIVGMQAREARELAVAARTSRAISYAAL